MFQTCNTTGRMNLHRCCCTDLLSRTHGPYSPPPYRFLEAPNLNTRNRPFLVVQHNLDSQVSKRSCWFVPDLDGKLSLTVFCYLETLNKHQGEEYLHSSTPPNPAPSILQRKHLYTPLYTHPIQSHPLSLKPTPPPTAHPSTHPQHYHAPYQNTSSSPSLNPAPPAEHPASPN
jgi:hypothetical protein